MAIDCGEEMRSNMAFFHYDSGGAHAFFSATHHVTHAVTGAAFAEWKFSSSSGDVGVSKLMTQANALALHMKVCSAQVLPSHDVLMAPRATRGRVNASTLVICALGAISHVLL